MSDASLLSRVLQRAANFRSAKEGNVAVIFGFSLVPMLLFIGGAIDYTHANLSRTAMQQALDSATLMLSKDVRGMTPDAIQAKGEAYFRAMYTDPYAQDVKVTVTYTATTGHGSQIVMDASAAMPTEIMYLAGYQKLPFGTSSTVVWGSTKLRVALALDNTGSMASANKMKALKTAAKNLLAQLEAAASNDGDVYVSIIPFAKDVNVGSTNVDAKWLRWDLGTCTGKKNGRTINIGFITQNDCTKAGGTKWDKTDKTSNWAGCVSDRDMDNDTLSVAPYDTSATASNATDRATQFPAENYSDCPTQLLPMTDNWTALNKKVDAMEPEGNTNQSIGMAWAWLSLLQKSPIPAPTEESDYKYNKVIILLSDGDNTQNRYYDKTLNGDNVVDLIDARQKKLCDNIKAIKDAKTNEPVFTIYTIQVNTANDNTSPVMSYCASSTNTYFSTTTAGGINDAFSSIGTALSKLRVAQ